MTHAPRRIDHVVVAVHDLDAAGAFYQSLGFQVVDGHRHGQNERVTPPMGENVLFAGSDGGAMMLIQTAKLNGMDPTAWLTDALERVVSERTKADELHTLLPWAGSASRHRQSRLLQHNYLRELHR